MMKIEYFLCKRAESIVLVSSGDGDAGKEDNGISSNKKLFKNPRKQVGIYKDVTRLQRYLKHGDVEIR